MKEKLITEFSNSLAKEISERKIYDIAEITTLIKMRLEFVLRDLMTAYSTQAETEYMNMLNQQSKNKIGSLEYIKLGYKLAAAKQKKASANRAANNMGREDDYHNLKQFILSEYGEEALTKFYEK
jgi:hypothetical protein